MLLTSIFFFVAVLGSAIAMLVNVGVGNAGFFVLLHA